MKVGAPFNPYRVFQGSFAPYWILEHRGVSAGAKLCYIRLFRTGRLIPVTLDRREARILTGTLLPLLTGTIVPVLTGRIPPFRAGTSVPLPKE